MLPEAPTSSSGLVPGKSSSEKAGLVNSAEPFLRATIEATRRLALGGDLVQGIAAALRAVGELTGLERVYLLRYDHVQRAGFLFADHCTSEATKTIQAMKHGPYPTSEYEESWRLLFANQICSSASPAARAFSPALVDAIGSGRKVMLPIFVGDAFWGVIGLDDVATERAHSELEINVLRGLATVFAAAIGRDTADSARHVAERARVAELERSNLELQRSGTLLTAAAGALKGLLSARDLNNAVGETLRQMGEAAEMHRVKVILQRPASGGDGGYHELVYEWWSPELESQTSLGLTHFPDDTLAVYLEPLLAGRSVWQLIDEVPSGYLEPFKKTGMQSMGIVPIFAGTQYIGLVAFDDCRKKRLWSETEMDALTIAARGLGAAIQREQLEDEKLEAVTHERVAAARARADSLAELNQLLTRRSRLLAAVTEISQLLLTGDDPVKLLQPIAAILGPASNADRVGFMLTAPTDSGSARGYLQRVAEWVGPGVPDRLQIGSSELINLDNIPVENWKADGQLITTLEAASGAPCAAVNGPTSRSELCIPIIVDDELWGSSAFEDCTDGRTWDEGEISALKIANALIAHAVSRRRAEIAVLAEQDRSSRDRASELSQANAALRRSTANLVELPDLPVFLGSLLLSAIETTGAKSGAVFTYDETAEVLLLTACVMDRRIVAIDQDPRLELWRTPVPEAVMRPWINQIRHDDVWFDYQNPPADHPWPISLAWHVGLGHRLAVDLPLSVGGKLVGFLCQCFTTFEWPNPFALEQVRVLAQQASVAIQLSRLAANARDAAVQAERNRLAREIHDTLAQSFTGILLQLEAADLLREQGDARAAERYRKIRAQAQLGLAETRRTALALAPEALSEGLLPALTQLCQRSHVEERMRCTFTYEGLARRLGTIREERLLRVAKEALSNAVRHGRATEISLHLAFAPLEVRLTVRDNGAGFSAADSSGLGLPNMRAAVAEAGGSLQIASVPNAGTTVLAIVPLTDAPSAKHPIVPSSQKP